MEININDVKFITETTLTIRGTRRRTTVPKRVVDNFKLENGEKLRWILFEDDKLLLTKVNSEKL
ncbi:MAG: hypothetical protein GON13_01410 [Nanoarchaeota archaeon]|nr:hypothetical protein [Nanoarchaeota archaeon]